MLYFLLGEPSHCFIHDGDGICEDFERPYSVTDCGYYTPPGFEDQWAKTAVANPEFQDDTCPESLIIGIPSRNQVSWCGFILKVLDSEKSKF